MLIVSPCFPCQIPTVFFNFKLLFLIHASWRKFSKKQKWFTPLHKLNSRKWNLLVHEYFLCYNPKHSPIILLRGISKCSKLISLNDTKVAFIRPNPNRWFDFAGTYTFLFNRVLFQTFSLPSNIHKHFLYPFSDDLHCILFMLLYRCWLDPVTCFWQ